MSNPPPLPPPPPPTPFALGAGADASFAFTGINGVQELPAVSQPVQLPPVRSQVELDRDAWRAAWGDHGRYLGDGQAENGRVLNRATASLRAEVARLGEALSLAQNAVTEAQGLLAGEQREKDVARKLAAVLLTENKLLTATTTTTTTKKQKQQQQQKKMESIRDLPGEEAYDRGVMLEKQVEQLEGINSLLKAQVQKLEQDVVEANRVRADSERELEEKREKVDELAAQVDKHKRDVELEKKGSQNTTALLDRAYADLHDAMDARKLAHKARDEAEALHHEIKLRFNDLHAEWEDSQTKIEQLEQQLDALHALEAENASLQTDMDNLVGQLADHDRTLIVKDERISHLETHLQKERQRNLEAQFRTDRQRDRIVTSGATSPTNEDPWNFIDSVNESLADELSLASQLDDDSLGAYEPFNEYSDVVNVIDIEPVDPASAPTCSFSVSEVASAAPVHPKAQPLSVHVDEAASATPAHPNVQPLSLHVNETASAAPVHPDVQPLSVHINEAASVTPVHPETQPLSIHIDEAASATPLHPDVQPLSVHVNEAANAAPIKPELAPFSLHVNESASSAPVQPDVQPFSIHVEATASAAPVHPDVQPLSVHVDEATSTTPVKPAVTSSTMHVSEAASVVPVGIKEPAVKATSTASAQTIISNPKLKITEFMVTHDEWPLQEIVPRRPTSDSTVQTDPKVEVEVPVQEVDPTLAAATTDAEPTSSTVTLPKHKASLLHRAFPFLSALLALWTALLWVRLNAWETANGHGYYTHTNHGGAFGNGRYFFGIPIAMDIGNSDFSEWLAGCMSILISGLDNWNGVRYVPHY